MKIFWTGTAIDHLDAVFGYTVQTSELYAKRLVDRITRRSQQIAEFPLSGRAVPEMDLAQVREVIEGPYRIIYHIKPDQIDILAVIHGAHDALRDA